MRAALFEFSLRHPGSLNEHSLTEGQSSERVTWILSCEFLRNWLTKLVYFTKHWDTLVLWMNTVWLKVNPVKEFSLRRESCPVSFWEIGLQSWYISQKIGWVPISQNIGWVPTFRGGSTHWLFLATPWFFEWTQFDWRSIQGESYVNPVLCVFEKLAYKVGIFHKTLAAFLRFVLSVLTEFFLQRHGSLHEHSLTEGQSSERVTWILSRAFFRNFLTKLTNFKKQWLSSYVLWWHYSLSFPCDTLVLCMNPAWLKVNPVRELRESCPVRLWEIGLQSWHISQKIGWVPTFHRGRYSLSFPCDTLVLCMNPAWLKVNPVRELRESCPARFCEIGLQSWQISKNHGWVPTFRGGSTHWIFLPWRSIQWENYVNPVLCDTLVLCMNTAWLKVNPVIELRESCPVSF